MCKLYFLSDISQHVFIGANKRSCQETQLQWRFGASAQVVEAANDANKAYEEENERLRLELEAAQQQLASVQQKQSSLPAVSCFTCLAPFSACVLRFNADA